MTLIRTMLVVTAALGLSLGAVGTAFAGAGATPSLIGDLDGDDISDAVLTSASNVIYLTMNGNGTVKLATATGAPAGYTIVATGDFGDCQGGSDDNADLVVAADDGSNYHIWCMNGGTVIANTQTVLAAGSNVTIVGAGDFNNDTRRNEILVVDGSNNLGFWNHDATTGAFLGTGVTLGSIGANGTVEVVGDFDGVTGTDILIRDSSTGASAIWFVNGSGAVQGSSGGIGTVATSTIFGGSIDVDGDDIDDIQLQLANGNVLTWFMDGLPINSASTAGNSTQQLVNSGDFGGANSTGLMFQEGSASNSPISIWQLTAAGIKQTEAQVATGAGLGSNFLISFLSGE